MSGRTRSRPPREIGLVLGLECLVAHVVQRRRAQGSERWQRSLALPNDSCVFPDLPSALAELRETLGLRQPRASLALLPGLAQLRRIELPRMNDDELRTVLTRDASRFFFDAREPQVIAFERLSAARGPIVPLMVACTPESVVEAVLAAAQDSRWQLDRIVPAYAAWTRAALARSAEIGRARGRIVVAIGTESSLLTTARGRLESIRRSGSRSAAQLAAISNVAGPEGDSGAGGPQPMFLDEPQLAAAANAPHVRTLELLQMRVHEARARRTRTITRTLFAVAAACLLASAPLELWGTRRELHQIEARRAAIKARVDGVMRVRDALGVVDRRIATLSTLEHTAPEWSAAMATVASHLPLDAYLVAFRGRADSLVLEGTAERATGVFEAIQRAPGVSGVRANAPIRQELDQEQRPVEHFAVALRLVLGGPQSEARP